MRIYPPLIYNAVYYNNYELSTYNNKIIGIFIIELVYSVYG